MSTKKRVLELLEISRGESLSGEYLAGLLNVTRNAVWKAINELKKDGYKIIAVTNKGYCLSIDNDIISVQGIQPFLLTKNQSDKIHVYQTLESTNKTAKEMAISNAEHGTVIISDCQTLGKGRYKRNFFSPSGGLYMSFILRPEYLHFENVTVITAFAAVSVCKAIETVTQKAPMIKWVNDIFLDGKKICGILTEAVTDFESGNLEWIVLGIGINVKTHPDEFPDDLRLTASSIYPNGCMFTTRNRLVAEIVNKILGLHTPPNETKIFDEYKKRLLMLKKKITVVEGQKEYTATAIDIDSAGHLVIEKENGEIHILSSGEIVLQN